MNDPLRLLIERVLAVCPDADIAPGPLLMATGSPTVRVLRTPGVPHPSYWVSYYDFEHMPPGRRYVVGGGYVDLQTAVAKCVRFLRGEED